MASLADVLVAATAMKDAIAAGEVANAWEQSFKLQEFGIEALRAGGFQAMPTDAATKQSIRDCLDECEANAKAHPAMKAKALKAAAPVGKIGDGHLLELLVKLITVLGPLFL